jgi:hypothetical protein
LRVSRTITVTLWRVYRNQISLGQKKAPGRPRA